MKLININENGIAWVKTDCGKVFGIVNAFKVLDEDGMTYPDKSVCDLLDYYVDIGQNFKTEANEIYFTEENGESYTLSINVHGVELIETND